ncbi:aminotransferase class V-fold PLP-dependent enzyme [Sphingobacterium sp. SRCM116780]|uniref:aminotransferase class V-fold PLP-dependent enzyme n=1 Tax=Sphingobacterium sp. SRCM116780 TaxID=2907623 RepID=UPI001F48E95B|nr:aminotransferase class V-fold PLP-dependent enzyme [Sphingobacterium sp. SRCM116780]UIR55371.1 aminotransferase class V-fold PLP-dependent enzyme [Sphingobacterium sp. SRCM116780]
MTQQRYKSYFDIPDHICYLTTPGSGLLPTASQKWRSERDKDFFSVSTDLRERQGEFNLGVKNSIAKFFTIPVNNVYNTSNFSTGFNALLERIPKDAKVLLLDGDYPSVNFPVIARGFQYVTAAIDEQLENNIFNTIKKHQPTVFIFSIVQYISGVKINLEFIRKIKDQFPELLIIGDGTQFLGTEVFDFSQSGFDIVGASGYKWLLGGYGNGFLLFSEFAKHVLFSQVATQHIQLDKMWDGKDIIQLYFEPGHIDTLSQGTLQQGIEFFNTLGLENTSAYTHQLVKQAKDELCKRNLLSPVTINRAETSTIFNLQIDQKHFSTLMENNIKCFPRGTGIRIGFHLYNDDADLERLLKIIDTKILT